MKKVVLPLLLTISMALVGCGSKTASNPSPAANPNTSKPPAEQPKSGNAKYPDKPITLVIQAAAGGSSDTVSRSVGKILEQKLKVAVAPVNKPGGSGAVAMSFVESSPKDGYTIGYVPVELTMIKSLGFSDIQPSKFDLLGRAMTLPSAITVQKDAPYNTIEEFIDFAKKNPGKLKVGTSGAGSIWHIAAAGFAQKAGIELNYIPFDGAAPAVTGLMGGHIDAVSVSPAEVKIGLDSNKLKVLAVMGAQRNKMLPDVPTLKEKGIDVEVLAWGGFAVPKGTPDEVKNVLVPALKEAINSTEFKQMADNLSITVDYQTPEEFTQFANAQFEFYSKLIPTMKLK